MSQQTEFFEFVRDNLRMDATDKSYYDYGNCSRQVTIKLILTHPETKEEEQLGYIEFPIPTEG